MNFEFGPFLFESGETVNVNRRSVLAWTLSYGPEDLATHHVDVGATRSSVIDVFRDDMAVIIRRFQYDGAPVPVLLQSAGGETLGSFLTAGGTINGMMPSIPDDSSEFWLVTAAHPVRSMRVTLTEFAALASLYAAAPHEWIQEALPGPVLTLDPAEWRAPTAWEIRHVVGEGSFTGISGSKAAELVGVTAQNFRKYTARDGAATRQNMSFSMWHLLLARLGVQRI